MAELFFEDDRMGVQDPNYNNQLQNTSFQQPNINSYQYGMNQRFNTPPSNWRGNWEHTYGMPGITGPNMRQVAGEVGEYGQIPGQGNVDMYTPQRNIFGKTLASLGRVKNRIGQGITGILDNTMMGRIAGAFNPTNPRSGNFNPMLQGQLDLATGGIDEGGLGWEVDDIGRYETGPLKGQASMSALGTNDPLQQLRNKLQELRTNESTSEINEEKIKDTLIAINRLTASQNKGYRGTPGGNTGSGAFSTFDTSTLDYGPHTKDTGGNTTSGGGNWGNAPGTPGGWDPGAKKDGGRIGYAFGRGPVLDPTQDENTLDFMQDQGVPYSEMAEESPFEMRIQELMDTGMSWQEAYQIASEEFGQVAEGESDQGLASLV